MRQRLGWIGAGVLVAAVVEIVVLVVVAKLLGVGLTLLLVLATMLVGGWLLQREGLRAWRALRRAMTTQPGGAAAGRRLPIEERPPGPDLGDGLVGLVGAVLLLVPGFVTDLVGLLLLVAPVRHAAGGMVRRRVERRLTGAVGADLFGPRPARVRVRRGGPAPGEPIEGEIVDG